ncbi:hypothetical protein DMJ13_06100 [halophilic archaeon]|nr:hypothetical protein DMJ13_06100 [halophilic archaeon]
MRPASQSPSKNPPFWREPSPFRRETAASRCVRVTVTAGRNEYYDREGERICVDGARIVAGGTRGDGTRSTRTGYRSAPAQSTMRS